MFTPTPGVIGTVQANAAAGATVLQIDNAYAAYLATWLGSTGWTYCMTQSGNSVEVLKITSVTGNSITVVRNVDNSTPLSLAGGVNQLQFVMGASAVQDMLTAQALAPAVVLTPTGALTIVENSPNNFTLGVPAAGITSANASLVITSAGINQFDLAVNVSTIGCCP